MGCEPEMEISKLIPGWEQHVVCHVLTQHYTKIKTAQLLRPLCVHNPGPKVIDVLFFLGFRLYSLLFLPLLFLFSWMFVWAAINYQLQKPIHRIWMNMVHFSMIAWNLATCGGALLWTSNCILLIRSVIKNLSIRETYFFPQFWSKSYWRSVFLRVFACILSCSYPCFSFSFDACLGCHQLSAAETHT